MISKEQHILQLTQTIRQSFNESDWKIIGLKTKCSDIINSHPRLLRSLSWGDNDYEGCIVDVLSAMAKRDVNNLGILEQHILTNNANGHENGMSCFLNTCICRPEVFAIPTTCQERGLVSLMMPFDLSFDAVANTIKGVATQLSLTCYRVDDIWDNSTIVQDVFSLIYKSEVVICDFSERNVNVFYEAGIAHTLGRTLIPLVQDKRDIPFDLQQHRYISYLNNQEGLLKLKSELTKKLCQIYSLPLPHQNHVPICRSGPPLVRPPNLPRPIV